VLTKKHISSRLFQPALVFSTLCLSYTATAKQATYESFVLSKKPGSELGVPTVSHASDRASLKPVKIKIHTTEMDSRKFTFAKESFLAEKRDQAIKILRQQMDAGLVKNQDNMLLRLGQLYAEKYMELSYQENEVYTAQLLLYEKKKAAGEKATQPKLYNELSRQYLKDALSLFSKLEKKAPNHPQIDEILFFIGFVEMEIGNKEKGSKYLERVVKNHKQSKKFEEAVVYLADYYFEKTAFKNSLEKYQILASKKDSSLFHYAVYKMAWCELNLEHSQKGLKDMKALIASLEGATETSKFNLREQALKDIVIFFGETGNVDEAMSYFSERQGKEKALENLRLIADILKSKARDSAAIAAYRRLLEESSDSEESVYLRLGIYECLNRMGKTEAAVDILVETLEKHAPTSSWASSYPSNRKEDLKEALTTVEAEGVKAAFFFHASAQKGANRKLYAYARKLYTALLKNFPGLAEKKKIHFYQADILYSESKWLEAADAYMLASKMPPKDKLTDECIYNALLALDQLTAKIDKITRYNDKEQKGVDLEPQSIPEGERRFIEIAELYLKDYPRTERAVDVEYRIAAIYYRYHHFDKAQGLFTKIALEHPRHRSARTAAYITLDIYNIKKDYEKLDLTAQKFSRIEGLGDKAFKNEMSEISGSIGFKKVEKFETDNKWKEAAESYLALYERDKNGALSEKSLYNALVSFEKAGNATKSNEVIKLFISKFPKSEYTQKLTLTLAKNAEGQYDFETAHGYYLDFYRKFPKDKEAKKSLYNAAVFSELLEKNKLATELYLDYLKDKSISLKEKKAVQLSLAKIYRKENHWAEFEQMYRRLVSESGSVEERLSYLGELSRQYEVHGKQKEREQVLHEIRGLYLSSGKTSKNVGPAMLYVAESEFHSIDKQKENYLKIELKFPPQDLVYLMGRKQKLLKKLAASYDSIVEMGVPEWGVAALYEKGNAYLDFSRKFRVIQIPAKLKGPDREEADKSLKQIEKDLVLPLEGKGQEYIKACIDKAAEFHVVSEYVVKCRNALKQTAEDFEPSGLIPKPLYWSTRVLGEELTKK
jgi:tetratricopeptide (TPR) repeat protein